MELSKMGKTELRAACKEHKVKNYSKLTVEGMREALTNLTTKADTARKPERVEQNGVRAPMKGVCADVWSFCDGWMKTTGSAPTAADVREQAAKVGWNQNNASIELSRWRRFNGIARPTNA